MRAPRPYRQKDTAPKTRLTSAKMNPLSTRPTRAPASKAVVNEVEVPDPVVIPQKHAPPNGCRRIPSSRTVTVPRTGISKQPTPSKGFVRP